MMRKILVLGYFGYNTNQLDGQTVKTRDIYRLVKEQNTGSVDYYDTENFKFNKFSILQMFWKLMRCKTLFYLPAHNNLKYIFPIVFLLSVVFRFKIHYFVVGGWLREYLSDMPMHRYTLKHITGIHVETKRLKNELEEYYQFENVDIFPNFRFFDFDSERFRGGHNKQVSQLAGSEDENIKLCFISRVEKSKGLDTLLILSKVIEERQLGKKVHIDFYGQKKDDFFDSELSHIEMFDYKGVIQPSMVVDTLQKYDALIFPTHYDGEGCPGILVEALLAGIPIIASNWKFNDEFVSDGINGFLCETFDTDAYLKAITTLFDVTVRHNMGRESYLRSEAYTAKNAEILLHNYLC